MPTTAPLYTPGISTDELFNQTTTGTFNQYMAYKKGRRKVEEPKTDGAALKLKKGFLLGCDPEGFVFNKKTGEPVPAAGLIPGTKHEPHKVDKGAIQVDGMAVEFNIDPVSTYEEWEENITTVIKQLSKAIPRGHEIRWIPSVRFPEAAFDAAPDQNKELGCDPDFDAWTGAPNQPPNPEDPYVRCAGGHIHFGFTENEDLSDLQHILNCQDLGKQLDWFLGGWSVFKDLDNVRRILYGKMGSIRYKQYGLEYRVLSNFWVATPELRREVWDRCVYAVECMAGLYFPDRAGHKVTEWLRRAIDKHDIHKELDTYCHFPLHTLNPSHCRL